MHDAVAIARRFVEEGINKKTIALLIDMVADDVLYQNMPLRPARGKAEFIDFCKDMGEIQDMTLTIRNAAGNGNIAFLERSDSWTMNGVKVVEPFVGVFEINADGKIQRWCDYFDLRSWEWSGQHPKEFFVKWAREDYKAHYTK